MDTVINIPILESACGVCSAHDPPGGGVRPPGGECPICLLELKKDIIETDCCKNKFHKKCYSTWILQNPTCPICRKVDLIPIKNPKYRCCDILLICIIVLILVAFPILMLIYGLRGRY